MRFTFILTTFSALLLGTVAQALGPNDSDLLNARAAADTPLMYERSAVEVPFQHSLRSFLEEAITAHRRALSADNGESLTARWVAARMIDFTHKAGGAKARSQRIACGAEESLAMARSKLTNIGLSAGALARARLVSGGRNLDLTRSAHDNNLADGSIVNVYVG